MRELTVAGLAAASLTLLALAVYAGGDRETVVPAPEVVAEGLLRQLATNRVEQTRQYLSRRARQVYSREALADWYQRVEKESGAAIHITGKDTAFDREQARATVVIEGTRRILPVRLVLVRERGLWRVERLPDTK